MGYKTQRQRAAERIEGIITAVREIQEENLFSQLVIEGFSKKVSMEVLTALDYQGKVFWDRKKARVLDAKAAVELEDTGALDNEEKAILGG